MNNGQRLGAGTTTGRFASAQALTDYPRLANKA